MATQLNIKDPVLIERVRTLAARNGEPVTATLRHLVDAAWHEREREIDARFAKMQAWTRKAQAMVPPELKGVTSKEIMDSIYDEDELDGFAR